MTDSLVYLALILSSLCLIFLIILLVRQTSLAHEQEKERMANEQALVNLGNKLLDELDAQHDESAESLYNANQSLMNTLSQMGQSQSTLLESMQRQVLLSTRNQEEKINDLRLENETGFPSPWIRSSTRASPRSANAWSPSTRASERCIPWPPASET